MKTQVGAGKRPEMRERERVVCLPHTTPFFRTQPDPKELHEATFQGFTINFCRKINKHFQLWYLAAGGDTPERCPPRRPSAPGTGGIIQLARRSNQEKYGVSQMFFTFFFLFLFFLKKKSSLWGKKTKKNFGLHAQSLKRTARRMRLWCDNHSQVNLSSVTNAQGFQQAISRKTKTPVRKGFLNNILFWYGSWLLTTPEGSSVS